MVSSYSDLNSLIPDPLSFRTRVVSGNRRRYRDNVDSYYTESEEEVLHELDEVAMAALPLHLQDNMREIHLERVRRLQRENNNPTFYKSSYHGSFPAMWFRSSMSRIAATQDAAKRDSAGLPDSSSRQITWHLRQRGHGMNGRKHAECETNRYSYSSSSFFHAGNNLFLRHSTSIDGLEAGSACDRLSSGRYLPELVGPKAHLCETHAIEGSGAAHINGRKVHARFRKRGSLMISVMRGRVQNSIQRMSKVFKK
ncbi:hypothetical protein BDV28DRAFT_145028 [Aspergillus coremiiformis]|uniref:Uncharacterized protein n=1 Tax=Aspergillus coremiiformis TaxID=138285 RepID=A0A5N6ZFW3_9EURO|nr:hypothetical protein BDV28DRAFT_145028 [Aspergillus coremiiformis]